MLLVEQVSIVVLGDSVIVAEGGVVFDEIDTDAEALHPLEVAVTV